MTRIPVWLRALLARIWMFGITQLGSLVIMCPSIALAKLSIEDAYVGATFLAVVAAVMPAHLRWDFLT